jgi:hypothetical protein
MIRRLVKVFYEYASRTPPPFIALYVIVKRPLNPDFIASYHKG